MATHPFMELENMTKSVNIIKKALNQEPIPIYGEGKNIRDWLYVRDHCSAICCVLKLGQVGEVYNIGGINEKTNLDVVDLICGYLNETFPRAGGGSYQSQITFVKDRAGHDKRYAIDNTKIEQELKGLKKLNKTASYELTTRLKHLILSVEGDYEKKTIRDFVDNYLLARDSRALREYIKLIQPKNFQKWSKNAPPPTTTPQSYPKRGRFTFIWQILTTFNCGGR